LASTNLVISTPGERRAQLLEILLSRGLASAEDFTSADDTV